MTKRHGYDNFVVNFVNLGSLMRWQIAQYIFCDQQQTLTSKKGTQQLEPMMVELLSFFCQNCDRIISKETLIEEVWLGRFVSDNAVSKLITKLRKSFEDEARQPRFIATFPKKGYKFIAAVKPLTHSDNPTSDLLVVSTVNQTQNVDITREPTQRRKVILAITAICVCIIAFILVATFNNTRPTYVQQTAFAKAFTTAAGDELFPSFSPDGTRVAYMSVKDGQTRLVIQDLASQQTVYVSHPSKLGTGPGDWRKDGKQIVYLAASPSDCAYYIRDIDGLTLGEPRKVHSCSPGSYGKVLYSHDNQYIVFSEAPAMGSPYSLYTLDLYSGIVKRLNQPELHLGGNSQFDLHPRENKLLISSPNKQQWEAFYSLDLDTDELKLLFAQDAYTCCGIWSHDGERIVLIGEHPSYQLVSYDLNGGNRTVLYSGSRVARLPRRHINGKDYVFSSAERDTNFLSMDLKTHEIVTVADASVDELLVRSAHHSNRVAFISFASGKEEVWLKDMQHKSPFKLTTFADSSHYIDLVWSPDDKHFIGLTLNEIRLIDAQTGEYQSLAIKQEEIRGVSFSSPNSVSYSVREGENWRVYDYHFEDHRITPRDGNWQLVQFDHFEGNHLWLDIQGELYLGKMQQPISLDAVPINRLLSGRQFNLRKRDSKWYWFEKGETSSIKVFDEQLNTVKDVVKTDVVHFDVNGSTLFYGARQQASSNLYQTQANL